MMMRLTASLVVFFLLHVFISIAQSAKPVAPEVAARGLLGRILPEDVDRFIFKKIPADEDHDVFEIESVNGRIIIRGNSGVSMAAGLNWYLSQRCRCNISWYGENLNLPDALPEV